jgi:hypothetical protein
MTANNTPRYLRNPRLRFVLGRMSKRLYFPSFEEGWPRRSRKCNATLDFGTAGEVKHCCNKVLTSLKAVRYRACAPRPRCALFKVARHFV